MSMIAFDTATPYLAVFDGEDGEDGGKMAYYALRWIGKDGLPGPWNEIVAATIGL